MTEKRFEAICELGRPPFLVDNSAKWVNSNGIELTVRRTFQGDYNSDSAFSDCNYFADLLNALHEENEQLKQEIKVLRDYGIELLEYINSPPKHRKSIWDAVIYFKNKKGDVE